MLFRSLDGVGMCVMGRDAEGRRMKSLMTAAQVKRRLAQSALLKRRMAETHETKMRAKLAAQWYLSSQFKPRYWTEEL